MKQLWMLIALLALPLISSAEEALVSKELGLVICQVYINAAVASMDALNEGVSVVDLVDLIRGSDIEATTTTILLAALELAAEFNYLNIDGSRLGYDFVRDEGMAMCLNADGDLRR